MQWAKDRESSVVISLGAAVDRVLELRVRPFRYPGAPSQTVSIDVNGHRRGTLVLDPECAVYRLPIPAASFRRGLNTLTFKYRYALAPAAVSPGRRSTISR